MGRPGHRPSDRKKPGGGTCGEDRLFHLEAMCDDLAAQGVAVHTQQLGRTREIPIRTIEDAQNESLLELALGVSVQDPFVDHLLDKSLK
jgi:hypothetical protein